MKLEKLETVIVITTSLFTMTVTLFGIFFPITNIQKIKVEVSPFFI